MKPQEFPAYLNVFQANQRETRSPIVAEAVIRKFGGGRGHETRTLHIAYSGAYRDGQQVHANAWMEHVCKVWNNGILLVNGYDGTLFEVDHNTVKVIVKGTTVKVSANMVEKENR